MGIITKTWQEEDGARDNANLSQDLLRPKKGIPLILSLIGHEYECRHSDSDDAHAHVEDSYICLEGNFTHPRLNVREIQESCDVVQYSITFPD